MSVKVKLSDIILSKASIDKLSRMSMPFKLAYRLQKITKKVNKETDEFESLRNRLIQENGEEDEGGIIKVKDDKIEWFMAELDTVLAEEVDLGIEPIPLDLFEGLEVSPETLMLVWFIFDETP